MIWGFWEGFMHQNYISHSISLEPEISLLAFIPSRDWVLYKELGFCNQNWPMFNTLLHSLETVRPSKATYAF